MTAEPRDVEEIRADLSVTSRGGGFVTTLGGTKAETFRLARDVEPLLTRLAAADRDNAELRGEVERLRRQVIDHAWTANDIDQSLRDRLSVVTKYRHERNEARSQLAAAQAQLAEAERRRTAAVRAVMGRGDAFAELYAERAQLRARLEAVRALQPSIDLVIAMPVSNPSLIEDEDWQRRAKTVIEALDAALSAAPQPEPWTIWPNGTADLGPESKQAFIEQLAGVPEGRRAEIFEPPASDEPARCGPCALCLGDGNCASCADCPDRPGPAASGTPDGRP